MKEIIKHINNIEKDVVAIRELESDEFVNHCLDIIQHNVARLYVATGRQGQLPYDTPVDHLPRLATRISTALRINGIETVRDLYKMEQEERQRCLERNSTYFPFDKLYVFRNISYKSVRDLVTKLIEFGFYDGTNWIEENEG